MQNPASDWHDDKQLNKSKLTHQSEQQTIDIKINKGFGWGFKTKTEVGVLLKENRGDDFNRGFQI